MYDIHELANIFPLMTEEEYRELKEDIQRNGIIEPITLYENKVLDGRNRYKACLELGITPELQYYNGDNPLSHVLSLNLTRRHLTVSQRAALAVDLLPYFEEQAQKRKIATLKQNQNTDSPKLDEREMGRSTTKAGEELRVGKTYVSEAKKIKEELPEVFEQVKSGELSLQDAQKKIKQIKKQRNIDERKEQADNITLDTNIILGDSSKLIHDLQDNSIDLLLTDPPYGMNFKSGWSERKEVENDDLKGALVILDNVLQSSLPKLKPNAHAYIFGNWRYIPQFTTIIQQYFTIKMLLIWDREVIGMGDLESYGDSYDVIYFCTHKEKRDLIWEDGRERNIIRIPRLSPDKLTHPTEKPVEVLEHLIKRSTLENEVVCDPFMGSGSACVAAKNLGRKYIGIEIDPEYFDIAQRRINGSY